MRKIGTKTRQQCAAGGTGSAAAVLAGLGLVIWFALSHAPMLFGLASSPVFGWNAHGAFETALPVMAAAVGYYAHKYPRGAALTPVWIVTGHAFGMLVFIPPGIAAQNYALACALTLAGLVVVLMAAAGLARLVVFLSSRQAEHLDR